MGDGMESSSVECTVEVSEISSDSGGYETAEVSEASEDYEDCGTEEVSESDSFEPESDEYSDETSESYEDCERDDSLEETEADEENAEEYDDYDDCGKDTEQKTDEVPEQPIESATDKEVEEQPEVAKEERIEEEPEQELETEPEVKEEEAIEAEPEQNLETEPEVKEEETLENEPEQEIEAEPEVKEEEAVEENPEQELETEPEIEEAETLEEEPEQELEAEPEVEEEEELEENPEQELETEPEVKEEEALEEKSEETIGEQDQNLESQQEVPEEETQDEASEYNAKAEPEVEEGEAAEEEPEQEIETASETAEGEAVEEEPIQVTEAQGQNIESQSEVSESQPQDEISEQNEETEHEAAEGEAVEEEPEQEIETASETAEGEAVEGESEEVTEEKNQNLESQQEVPEEETQDEVTQEEVTEQSAEVTEDIESTETSEGVDEGYNKEGSEFIAAKELRDTNAERIEQLEAENENLKEESSAKFEAALSADRSTQEYKDALREYNETKDRQAEVETNLSEARQQQEELEQKTIRLRDAQIEKGQSAAEASAYTIENANQLHEKFEDQIYSEKPDLRELQQLKENNSLAISELSSQRDSVHLAMDAKMSEIGDYVRANNMDRFDTERDPYYQQLIGQYRSLNDAYRRLDYNVARLDENNIQIAEIRGEQYDSVRFKTGSDIKEVNSGTDIPGETNYFVDEVKTKEVLTSFKQDNWEKLSVKEQKSAIENLANYNAGILGIENPPAIVYYSSDDMSDFGGYSESHHTIYINEKNMSDAAETADTISHEYRHCYQHERAEKLENERDLEFMEGFDNYIAPENDYAAYRNQLVEQDARDYAEVLKGQIAKLDSDGTKEVLPGMPEDMTAKSFETMNPEKGAVFDEIAKEQLPEDFRKKIVETREFQEVFEEKELQEIKDHVAPSYENGVKIADRIKEFNTYKEHHLIDGGHIGKVHDKSLQAADVFGQSFSENSYGGLYSGAIDRKTLEMMALYHDTGMDGNISADKFDETKAEVLKDQEFRNEYIQAQMKGKNPLTFEEAEAKFEREGFESQFRKEHSVQSAIHVLRDRQFIEGKGVDADRVALGCLAHSKSNSGVGNLVDPKQWDGAIDRLNAAVDKFNADHPDEKIVFNSSFIKNLDGTFKQDALSEMSSEALCLRISDASGHDSMSRTSQNGKEIDFSLDDWKSVQNDLPADLRSKIESGDCNKFFSEVQNAKVKVDGELLDNETDKDGYARMFALGEGNFKSIDLELVDGTPTQKFELENSDAYPLSTQFCILERLKEVNTAKIEPDITVEKPEGMTDEKFAAYKQDQLDSMQKINFLAEINIGDCDDITRASYESFADKVKAKYNIDVRIVPERGKK